MLEDKVYNFIIKYNLIKDGDRLVLGVSGGPDSICMLHILNSILNKKLINFKMVVCHVNHGIRENAKIDEKFVEDFCREIGVEYFVKHANIKEIAEIQKRGLEEVGRDIRYSFFNEILYKTNSNKIAIAHNSNDRAETIVMNILRGTGIRGLIGIEKINGKYIRPLIEISRCEIENYLKENNILYRHDESNDDNIYTRNKIRNIVIPYIKKEFNPNIIETMKRLSDIAIEQENYIQKQTEKIYKELCINEINITNDYLYNKNNGSQIIINLTKFNNQDILIQKRIILYAIQKIFGTTKGIEKIHLEDIIKLCNRNIGNKFLCPNKFTKIVIKKKQIVIMSV